MSSRLANSKRNLVYGFFSQTISIILNFLVRIVFIKYLDTAYLGVNGLFSNILTVLSLTELGFTNAMLFNLYKPIANNDRETVKSLMKFYSKVYTIIGVIVAVIGILLIPFLKYLVKDMNLINNLYLIYVLFIFDSASSYLFTYKRAILSADQKEHVIHKYRFIFLCIRSLAQCMIIILFKNFILYLIIKIVCTFLENIFLSKKVGRIYPYLNEKNVRPLDKNIILSMKKDIEALFLSKISNISLNGTDNIIISMFSGLKEVGILSNYTLISGTLTSMLHIVSSSFVGSLGNYIAKENLDNQYSIFKKIDFMYFCMYSFCFLNMINIYNPFISVFFGKDYVFEMLIVFIFCLNFLIEGLLQSFWNFRSTMGLFTQGKYRPIFASVINIIASIILGYFYGVFGVLLGTTLSRVCVNAWYDPYIIFKCGLKRSPKQYYRNYITRVLYVVSISFANILLRDLIFKGNYNFFNFLLITSISVISSLIFIVLPYFNSEELSYFKSILYSYLKK